MGFGEPHSWPFCLGVHLLPYDMVSIQLKSSRVGLLPISSHILMSLQNINDHDFIDAFHTIFDSNTNTFFIFRVYHTQLNCMNSLNLCWFFYLNMYFRELVDLVRDSNSGNKYQDSVPSFEGFIYYIAALRWYSGQSLSV